jgi:hypothetical protein
MGSTVPLKRRFGIAGVEFVEPEVKIARASSVILTASQLARKRSGAPGYITSLRIDTSRLAIACGSELCFVLNHSLTHGQRIGPVTP